MCGQATFPYSVCHKTDACHLLYPLYYMKIQEIWMSNQSVFINIPSFHKNYLYKKNRLSFNTQINDLWCLLYSCQHVLFSFLNKHLCLSQFYYIFVFGICCQRSFRQSLKYVSTPFERLFFCNANQKAMLPIHSETGSMDFLDAVYTG